MKRPALFALAIVIAFSCVRYEIYRAMPVENFSAQLELWNRRDAWMTLPRLAGFLACVWYARRDGGFARWGWRSELPAAGALVLALTTAAQLLFLFANQSGSDLSAGYAAQGWLTSGPVALYEEAAFRSLLFLSLRESRGPRSAAIISSLLFMFFHIQAQSLWAWPEIFVFGFGACAALHAGAGLWNLVLVHWFVDGVGMSLFGGPPLRWALFPWLACAALSLAYSWSLLDADQRLAEIGM